jgi:hypothetical protein
MSSASNALKTRSQLNPSAVTRACCAAAGKRGRIYPAAKDADPAEAQCGKLITQLRSRYQSRFRAIMEPTQRAHDRLSQGLKPVVTAVLVELGVEAGDGR